MELGNSFVAFSVGVGWVSEAEMGLLIIDLRKYFRTT